MQMFVPLHIVSGYTFLSSGLTIEKIVSNVHKYQYSGAAITDLGVMFGIPPFVKLMSKYNFKKTLSQAENLILTQKKKT